MRVLIQRVSEASVAIGGREVSRIGAGLLLLVGIEEADSDEDMEWLAGKVARLRVFDDGAGVMNLDIVQTGGEVLAVSQFTLHASTRKGNRPSYIRAARPETAEPLYEKFVARLSRELGGEVRTGVFGADMKVALVNDGPVTILIDSKGRE
jgi:D-tyrosyl-tRNA(Tyr) deacylase